MQRATKDEQKAERRQKIMNAAWSLFQTQPYEAVNMLDVAKSAGLAKGTVYLYFKTKEALFMAVLQQQFGDWFEVINGRFSTLTPPTTPTIIAQAISHSLAPRPALTRLFSRIHLVLENNVDYQTALQYKQMLRDNVGVTGVLLEELLPVLPNGHGAALLLQIYAILLGTHQMAHPAPIVQQLLAQESDLQMFDHNFEHLFTHSVTTLITGTLAQIEAKHNA